MSSLKQKILKEAKTQIKLTRERAEIWNKHNYKEAERLGLIQYVPIDDVFTILDEATKELLNLAVHGLQEAQNGESSDCASTFATIIEKLGIHVEYDEWHEPIIDAKQVKAVLEGVEQK